MVDQPQPQRQIRIVLALHDDNPEVRRTAAWIIEDAGIESFAEFRDEFETGLDADARPDAAVFIAEALQRIDAATERDAPR